MKEIEGKGLFETFVDIFAVIGFAVVVGLFVTFLIVLGMNAYSEMSFEAQQYRESHYLPWPELVDSSYESSLLVFSVEDCLFNVDAQEYWCKEVTE